MAYHGQLLWEESYIDMPFLLEDLPFLNLFDGPEVSVYEVLAILADRPSTTLAALQTNQTNQTMHSATAIPTTNTQIDQSMTRFKKSCKTCTGRKIKCVAVEGSDPKICVRCRDKGLECEYEVKKEYVRTV